HVFDDLQRLRITVGWWMDGLVRRFGLHVRAADGATTLLDDRGILQTWQEGGVDNVQAGAPMTLNIFLPPETRSIRRAILRFRLLPFRAYSTGAASGGGHTTPSGGGHTTPSGGGHTSGTFGTLLTSTLVANRFHLWSATIIEYVWPLADHIHAGAGSHDHGGATQAGGSPSHTHPIWSHGFHEHPGAGGHTHVGATEHWHDVTLPDHTHAVQNHSHSVNDHSHPVQNHSHDVQNHSHSVNDHIHAISYGIFTGTTATGVTIVINGVDRTTALGGPFIADQSNLNIAPFLNIGQWNTIALGSSQLGRIDATTFIQALMGV
ncbi:MAG TPA: hypothetical protein VLH56_07340, partial [Dissulfurispiraceae bacterium]|nr:hypothetical protein [Dissulfurispiraceae bacterium]